MISLSAGIGPSISESHYQMAEPEDGGPDQPSALFMAHKQDQEQLQQESQETKTASGIQSNKRTGGKHRSKEGPSKNMKTNR